MSVLRALEFNRIMRREGRDLRSAALKMRLLALQAQDSFPARVRVLNRNNVLCKVRRDTTTARNAGS